MKIAWLHSHFLYSVGATRYIYEVSKRLASHHEITIFVERSSLFWKEKFAKEGIVVREISSSSSNSPIYWLFFPFLAFCEIIILRKEINGFDLVITSIFPMNWFSLYLNKPNIFLCFEPYSFFYNKDLIDKLSLLKKISVWLLARIYSRFDYLGTKKAMRVLALNEDRSALISKIYQRRPDGITGIAVDGNFFKPVRDKKIAKKYVGKKLIFHSTDFTAPKGTHYLIKALSHIIKEVPEIKLLIASTLENIVEKKMLEKLIFSLGFEKNIEFLGTVKEELLPVYYTLADVTAFVADPQNTVSKASLIVLESLACQTPVVCSVGQLTGMIDKKTGYFVNPRDTRDLAEKIKKILKDDKIRKKMGIFGRNLVLRKYRWENVVDSFKKQINIVFRLKKGKKLKKVKRMWIK